MQKRAKMTAPHLPVDRARDVRQASDVADMWPKRKKRRGDNDEALAAVRNEAMKPRARIGAAVPMGKAANDAMAELVVVIEARLRHAADVLRRMPAGRLDYPSSAGSCWPSYVRDYYESYGARDIEVPRVVPDQAEIDWAMEFMILLGKLDERERRIVSAKAYGATYRDLAKELGGSKSKIEREHKAALQVFAYIAENSMGQAGQKVACSAPRSK